MSKIDTVSEHEGHEAGPDLETKNPSLVGEIEDHVKEMGILSATLVNDIARLDGPDAEEVKSQLLALQQEVKEAELSLWQRIAELAARPVSKVKAYFELRQEQALAIPDNPKIISEIKQELRNAQTYGYALRDKLEKKGMESLDARGQVDIDPEYSEAVDDAHALFTRAHKKDQGKWDYVVSRFDEINASRVYSLIVADRLEEALDMWDKLSDGLQEERVKHFANTIVSHGMEKLKTQEFSEPTIGNFLKRKHAFNTLFDTLQASIRVPYLREALTLAVNDQKSMVFSNHYDSFLLSKDEASVVALSALEEKKQKLVLGEWGEMWRSDLWEFILSHKDASDLVSLYLRYPILKQSLLPEKMSEVLTRYSIKNIDSLFEKVASKYSEYGRLTGPEFDGIIAMASLDIDADKIVGLDTIKLESIGALSRIYSHDQLKELLSNENVADYKEVSAQYLSGAHDVKDIFAKKVGPAVIRFFSKVSRDYSNNVAQRQDGTSIDLYAGIQGKTCDYIQLQKILALIPEQFHESLFALLSPPPGGFLSVPQEAVSEECVQNFIIYQQEVSGVSVTLSDIFNHKELFAGERWKCMEKGMEFFKQKGLFEVVKDKPYTLTLFESAGNATDEQINILVAKYVDASDLVVVPIETQLGYGEKTVSYKKLARSKEYIEGIYAFDRLCQHVFSHDAKEMAEFLRLDEFDLQIITSFLSGELGEEDYLDMPAIEGEMVRIGRCMAGGSKEVLDKMLTLDTKQKQIFLTLREMYPHNSPESLFTYVDNGQGEIILASNKKLNIKPFLIEHAVKLAEIADPGILFYFHSILGNRIEDTALDSIVKKCQELDELGLSRSVYLGKPASQDDTIGWGDSCLENFLSMPSVFIVKAIDILHTHGFRPKLKSVTYLNSSEDMGALERRVRTARAFGETYVSRYGDVASEEKLTEFETRSQQLEQALPEIKIDAQNIFRYMRIDQETATVLLGEPTILRFFIKSTWDTFPGFSVSKELLENPLFWQVEIPSEIYANNDLFARHVEFLKQMNDCGEKVRSLKDVSEWIGVYENMEQVRSVFGAEILKSHSFDVISEFAKKDLEKFRDFTTFFSSKEAGGYKVREAIKLMEQWTPEKRALFTEVRVLCGCVLPCELAESIDTYIDTYATAEEVVEAMDKNRHNYHFHTWAAFRMNVALPEYVAEKYPKACMMFESTEMTPHLGELQQCGEVAFQHLEQLAAYGAENEKVYGFRYFSEQILFIANHAQFDTIFEFIQARDTTHDSLINLSIDELREFCDGIHSETLSSVAAVCEYGEVQLKDCTAFLRHPDDVSRFVVFAKKMYEIFGKKISIQDFYLMDVEHISKTLAHIDEHTLSVLTEDSLKRMLVVTEGDMANELRLVLASFDRMQSISTGDALERLQSVPKEFQWSIIKTKASNFGWELLDQTDRLYQLGLTDAQFEELWVSLHKKLGLPEKKPIDARTAGILLKHGSSDYYGGNKKVISHILSYRSEPIEKYYELFIAHKKLVGESMAWSGSALPDMFTDDICLSLFFESDYEGFIDKLHLVKPEFIAAHSKEIIAGIKTASAANGIEFLVKCCKGEVALSPEDITLLTNEVHTRTLSSSAHDCHKLLYKSMDGVVLLTPEQQSSLANAYLLLGGVLPDKQHGNEGQNKAYDIIMVRVEEIVQGWKENVDGAIVVLSKLLKQKKFTNEHLDILHAIMTDTDAGIGAQSHKDIHHVFIEYLIYVDPTIKETINNDKKLGRLKDVVINKIIEYIQSLSASGKVSHQEIQTHISKKLQEISRVFGSSDTKESDKRLIFMDMYDLKRCNDPTVKDLSSEEIAVRLRQDVEEVVALSGSESQIRNMRRQIEFMDDPEEKKEAEKKLSTMLGVMQRADERNRNISDYLPPGALTHGFSHQYLELSLEYGNVSGELLGPDTKTDVSGLLGVDLSKVIGENSAEQSFVDRYRTLRNGSYGDVVLVYGDYTNEERTPYFSGAIGSDHFLVRAGVPTSEVTSIILRNNDATMLDKAKKAVATKGFYIPLVNVEGNLLFTQEEYDRMRVFYHSLHKKGYPREVIDNVYSYVTAEKGEKHQAVMDSVQTYIQSGTGKIDVDLAVLVDFLRTNDLNERPPEWYKQQSFETLYAFIKKTVGRKKRSKARGELFGKEFADSFGQPVISGEEVVQPERQRNAFIDAFLERQIPFVHGEGDEASFERKTFENDLTSMLFREKTSKAILEIAGRFSEFKKDFMRKLWSAAWDKIVEATGDNEEDLAAYKKFIVPAVVGSVGRGEVVLGSDLDYLLYVDDVSESLTGEQLNTLKYFINNKLGPEMNRLLEENGIHADAGLAKADRVPFTLLSSIRDFKIDLTQSRQVEEPTNMLDSEALFSDQSATVASAKELLLVENKTAHLLDSYIAKDLEIGTERFPGYQAQFEQLYNSVASGALINRVKESLQRAVMFKLYYLIFEGLNSGKIPKDEAKSVPASVGDKIDLLTKYKILSQKEAGTCRDLTAFAYKLRFLGEVYSSEAKQTKQMADKVRNVQFKLDDISYDERLRLVDLLKEFKSTVLYK